MKTSTDKGKKAVTFLTIVITLILTATGLHFNNINKNVSIKSKLIIDAEEISCYTSSCGSKNYLEITIQSHKEAYIKYTAIENKKARAINMERMQEQLDKTRLVEEAEAAKKADLEKERLRRLEEKKKATQVASRSTGYQANYEMTFYTAFCPTGCTGKTASGHDVSNTIYYQGYRIVAAPPNIKLYTKLRITFADGNRIDAIVLDRGGAIQGKPILDLLVSSREEAYRLGRQQVKVEVIN
jgi:3D (Asp-Asp-Asp) domain-containing protein